VSLHFRGPVQLKQFAVYTPSSSGSSSKLKEKRSAHARRHGHQHFHEHQQEVREIQEAHEEEKRAVGDIVVATINGKVVSWVNAYAGAATSTAAAATTAATAKVTSTVTAAGTTITSTVKAVSAAAISSASSAASSAAASSAAKSSTAAAAAASGDWSQIAYYNSADGTAHGLTFLNHFGGSGSGVFDYKFGNSLSYASADGKSCASSPQVLKDITLSSNTEIVIQSDKECKSGSCGYTRPGAVSYHGFDGAHKAFFFEFSMPLDGNRGTNGDMPAIWMLNNQIPNTI
ncbi:target of Sbf, partial [Cryomyces antarcticus]